MFFFFKQKTAYEIRPCDWSSDVCSSDLGPHEHDDEAYAGRVLFQHGLDNRQHRLLGNRARRVQRHVTVHARVEKVVFLEDRLEDDAQELRQARVLEIQRDTVVGGITVPGTRTGALHEHAGAFADSVAAFFFFG